SNANQGLTNSEALLSVENMSYGATYTKVSGQIGVNATDPVPLLPVANMNLTGSDRGWSVSESFPQLHDNASLIETNTTSTALPSTNDFVLTVTNTDPVGSGRVIAKVSLLVDNNLTSLALVSSPVGWVAVTS